MEAELLDKVSRPNAQLLIDALRKHNQPHHKDTQTISHKTAAHLLRLAIARDHAPLKAATALLDHPVKLTNTQLPTLIIDALKAKLPQLVPRILAAAAEPPNLGDFNTKGTEWTPLMYAAKSGDVAALDAVIRAGAPLDATERSGGTPLMVAVQYGQASAVHRLLDAGAPTESCDEQGWSAMLWAAQCGELAIVQALLSRGAALESTAGSALLVAVENGRCEVVDALLDAGAAVDARDAQGWTPLAVAAASGNARLIRLLLARGSLPRQRYGASGRTPLMAAAQGGHVAAVELLLGAGAGEVAPLDSNTAAGGPAAAPAVRQMLASDVDDCGVSALMLGCKGGHVPVVERLLTHGADANSVDNAGHGPLDLAGRLGSLEITRALLRAGADLTARARALPIAAKCGHAAVVRALGEAGAPMQPALMRAAAAGETDYVITLLKAGAATDPQIGAEAIMAAAFWGHRGIVSLLLSAGADATALGRVHGRSPLMLAAARGHAAVVRSLVEAGVPLDATDMAGKSALDLAAEAGHLGAVDELLREAGRVSRAPSKSLAEDSGTSEPLQVPSGGATGADDAALDALIERVSDSSVRARLMVERRRRVSEAELMSLKEVAAASKSRKAKKREASRQARRAAAKAASEATAVEGDGTAAVDSCTEMRRTTTAQTVEETPTGAEQPPAAVATVVSLSDGVVSERAAIDDGTTESARNPEALAPEALAHESVDHAHRSSPIPEPSTPPHINGAKEEEEDDDDDAHDDGETFGSGVENVSGWLPSTDLVHAGGRVVATELDMESLARQAAAFSSRRFAERGDSVPSGADEPRAGSPGPELLTQLEELQLQLAAEKQCVLREQHITARMWLEKSQAEEEATECRTRCEELGTQLAAWEGWHTSVRSAQRARRQRLLGSSAELLQQLLSDIGASSAFALAHEQRLRFAGLMHAAAEALATMQPPAAPGAPPSLGSRPPGLAAPVWKPERRWDTLRRPDEE